MPDLSRRAILRTAEMRVLRLRLLRLGDEVALIRRDRLSRKYNPDQPRVPAGNSGGGRWTSGSGGGGGSSGAGDPSLPGFGGEGAEPGFDVEGSDWASLGEGWSEDGAVFEQAVVNGDGATIHSEYAASREAGFDERQTVTLTSGERISFETADRVQTIALDGPDGGIVSRSLWTPSGPEPDATIQPAFSRRDFGSTIISGGAVLFGWQSRDNGIDGSQAILGFNARDYRPGEIARGALDLSYVGRITQSEVEAACRYLPDMQARLDDVVAHAGSISDYPSAGVYGSYVHQRLKEQIDAANYPDLHAEVSTYKIAAETDRSAPPPYGYPNSIRIDAVEYRADGTMCVYDFKTGKAGLTPSRSFELGLGGYLHRRSINRAIVIELRPTRR